MTHRHGGVEGDTEAGLGLNYEVPSPERGFLGAKIFCVNRICKHYKLQVHTTNSAVGRCNYFFARRLSEALGHLNYRHSFVSVHCLLSPSFNLISHRFFSTSSYHLSLGLPSLLPSILLSNTFEPTYNDIG